MPRLMFLGHPHPKPGPPILVAQTRQTDYATEGSDRYIEARKNQPLLMTLRRGGRLIVKTRQSQFQAEATLVTPPPATLTITTFAPTVSTPRAMTPVTKSLTITTFAPTVSTPRLCTPGVLALTTTKFAPTVSTPRLVTPGTKALTLTTFAPTVATPRLCTPATKALTLTTFAPTVTAGSGITCTPTTKALALSLFAPTVTIAPRPTGNWPGIGPSILIGR